MSKKKITQSLSDKNSSAFLTFQRKFLNMSPDKYFLNHVRKKI